MISSGYITDKREEPSFLFFCIGISPGKASVEITLYCRDGWADQHQNTADPNHGLNEIDLLDNIAEKLQFLNGEQFKPLEQTEDETLTQTMDGIFAYKQSFSTMIYRKLAPNYKPIKMKLKEV